MPPTPRQVLLVIPAYEEAERLPPFLDALASAIAASPLDGQVTVLVVDDGSAPGQASAMADAVQQTRDRHPFVEPIRALDENQGKGGAVYAGWDTATSDTPWLAFVDADGAVSPQETVRLLSMALDQSHPPNTAVYALRDIKNHDAVQRTALRGGLGQVFSGLVRFLFDFPVTDTQCGLKIVPRAAFAAARPSLTEMRFCFDIDLTAHLLRGGTAVQGVPIRWHESPGSKVRFSSAFRMLLSLFSLRLKLGATG